MPNKTAKDAPKTLPPGAAKIWAGAFNGAWEGTCKGEGERRDECAARVAWAAVKKKYKRSGKTWVRKSDAKSIEELSLEEMEATYQADFIVMKTSSAEGELRWVGRASDTFEDNLGTRMTKTLFMNFIRRSEFFGMPYLGVAHYGALEGKGIAGPAIKLWIDGAMFKASGIFHHNSLGLALYGALNTERSDPDLDPHTKIRLSLGFLDLRHTHGDQVFERESLYDECEICRSGELPDDFLDGILIHLAATRVPINTRTDLEIEPPAEVVRSDAFIKTRYEDAASIVGEDLACELESMSLALAQDPDSEFSKASIRLSDSQTEVEETDGEKSKEVKTMSGNEQLPGSEQELEEPTEDQTHADSGGEEPSGEEAPGEGGGAPTEQDPPAPVPNLLSQVSQSMEPVQQALAQFSEGVVNVLQTPGLSREERLEQLQPLLYGVADGLRAGVEQASQDPQTMMVQAFSQAVRQELAPIVEGLQQLVVGLSSTQAPPNSGRRTHNHVPQLNQRNPGQAPTQPESQIRSLARRSTGLEQ